MFKATQPFFQFKKSQDINLLEQDLKSLLKKYPSIPPDTLFKILGNVNRGQGVSAGATPEPIPQQHTPSTITNWVYFFSQQKTDGRADMKDLLGGKGANLAEMARIGCPVPPGFTLTTQVCGVYHQLGNRYPEELHDQVTTALQEMEKVTGKEFGNASKPLLVSVRSGAAVSMPGMMDTVLNLGLNDVVVAGLAKLTRNERFAWDSYRRFIQMYGNVVKSIGGEHFEEALGEAKKKRGAKQDTELTAEDLKQLVSTYKQIYHKHTTEEFPSEPETQLWGAITAVFASWNNPRAIKYRELNEITGLLGTAVNVQTMVYGNMGDSSATGVCFSRNPSTGRNKFYGEWLRNAQGEDVVSGIRTPQQISKELSQEWAESMSVPEEVRAKDYPSLEEAMPELYKELEQYKDKLTLHYTDMQDMEFTIEEGKLYMLQTRNGKRTALAAVNIAVDLVNEGMIDKTTALMRINPKQLHQLLHPLLDPKQKVEVLGKGLPASPGVAVGRVVFSAAAAEVWAQRGEKVILVRTETSPEDIAGMHVSEAIVTCRGGMTSHAAVVARGMGRTCVAAVDSLSLNEAAKTGTIGKHPLAEGDWLTINGNTGQILLGQMKLIQADPSSGKLQSVLTWCKEFKRLGVRANADTVSDCKTALSFGAEGVGLVRTEHMFFDATRIRAVREMILAEDTEGRLKALKKLAVFQKADFTGILKTMGGKPVTVRLLDPPLHEFLPKELSEMEEIGKSMGMSAAAVHQRMEELHEVNPMLGHRGCRLAITYPEIYDMQVRALLESVIDVMNEQGTTSSNSSVIEIMIPLVGVLEELKILKKNAVKVAEAVMLENHCTVPYKIGTMIEVPRAALIADQLAKEAEFFSFGTNDLTQMCCGFSRDDAASFIKQYVQNGIFSKDPFQSLDQEGVGQLMQMAITKGRSARAGLKCGICGEQGGDPTTVKFCHNLNMSYVSCSPFRVPIALLAAAQATIELDHQ